jgi:hypothetical protein
MTTKTTHTPGPWELTIDDNGHGDIVAGSLKVCSVGYVGLFPVAQADARLIASSPALLAALKNASRALTALDPLARHHDATLLDNALSQAEGGTQPF